MDYGEKGVVVLIKPTDVDDETILTVSMLDPNKRVRKIITQTNDALKEGDWIEFLTDSDGNKKWQKLTEKVLPTKLHRNKNGKVSSVMVKVTVVPTTEPITAEDVFPSKLNDKNFCIGFSKEVGRVLIAFNNTFPKHCLLECWVGTMLNYPENSQYDKLAKQNAAAWVFSNKEEHKLIRKAEATSQNLPFVYGIVIKKDDVNSYAWNGDYGICTVSKFLFQDTEIELGDWLYFSPIQLDKNSTEDSPNSLAIYVTKADTNLYESFTENGVVYVKHSLDVPNNKKFETLQYKVRISAIGKVNDTSSLVLSNNGKNSKLEAISKCVFLNENLVEWQIVAIENSDNSIGILQDKLNDMPPTPQNSKKIYVYTGEILLIDKPILKVKKELPSNIIVGDWLRMDLTRELEVMAYAKIPAIVETRVREEKKKDGFLCSWVEVRVPVVYDPNARSEKILHSYIIRKVIDKKLVFKENFKEGIRIMLWCKRVDNHNQRGSIDAFWAVSDKPNPEIIREDFEFGLKTQTEIVKKEKAEKTESYFWKNVPKQVQYNEDGEEILEDIEENSEFQEWKELESEKTDLKDNNLSMNDDQSESDRMKESPMKIEANNGSKNGSPTPNVEAFQKKPESQQQTLPEDDDYFQDFSKNHKKSQCSTKISTNDQLKPDNQGLPRSAPVRNRSPDKTDKTVRFAEQPSVKIYDENEEISPTPQYQSESRPNKETRRRPVVPPHPYPVDHLQRNHVGDEPPTLQQSSMAYTGRRPPFDNRFDPRVRENNIQEIYGLYDDMPKRMRRSNSTIPWDEHRREGEYEEPPNYPPRPYERPYPRPSAPPHIDHPRPYGYDYSSEHMRYMGPYDTRRYPPPFSEYPFPHRFPHETNPYLYPRNMHPTGSYYDQNPYRQYPPYEYDHLNHVHAPFIDPRHEFNKGRQEEDMHLRDLPPCDREEPIYEYNVQLTEQKCIREHELSETELESQPENKSTNLEESIELAKDEVANFSYDDELLHSVLYTNEPDQDFFSTSRAETRPGTPRNKYRKSTTPDEHSPLETNRLSPLKPKPFPKTVPTVLKPPTTSKIEEESKEENELEEEAQEKSTTLETPIENEIGRMRIDSGTSTPPDDPIQHRERMEGEVQHQNLTHSEAAKSEEERLNTEPEMPIERKTIPPLAQQSNPNPISAPSVKRPQIVSNSHHFYAEEEEMDEDEDDNISDANFCFIGVVCSRDFEYENEIEEECYLVFTPDLPKDAYVLQSVIGNRKLALADYIRFNVIKVDNWPKITEYKKIKPLKNHHAMVHREPIDGRNFRTLNTIKLSTIITIPHNYHPDVYGGNVMADVTGFQGVKVKEIEVNDRDMIIQNRSIGRQYQATIVKCTEDVPGTDAGWILHRLMSPEGFAPLISRRK